MFQKWKPRARNVILIFLPLFLPSFSVVCYSSLSLSCPAFLAQNSTTARKPKKPKKTHSKREKNSKWFNTTEREKGLLRDPSCLYPPTTTFKRNGKGYVSFRLPLSHSLAFSLVATFSIASCVPLCRSPSFPRLAFYPLFSSQGLVVCCLGLTGWVSKRNNVLVGSFLWVCVYASRGSPGERKIFKRITDPV